MSTSTHAAPRSNFRVFLTALAERRTYTELLYALLGLPVGVAGFVFVVTTTAVSGPLLITFVGLPLIALTGLIARVLGNGVRHLSNALQETDVPPPEPFRGKPGLLGWLGSCLADGTAWRARLYLLLKFPVGIASFVAATVVYCYGVAGLTYWIWWSFLPCNSDDAGVCHDGASIAPDFYLDAWWKAAVTALVGAVVLLVAPWVVRGVLLVDRILVRYLLGPTPSQLRLEHLRRGRAHAVDESAATLRRIERDLHDGTQARLVTLAMKIGLAKEKLAEGGDAAEATELLESAHTTAKQAIVELRDIARGIHPPVLDAGLETALATLAAHSAVPVQLRTAIPVRPSPAVETIAYFCVAELLTNVAKHSGAKHAVVDVRVGGTLLRITVNDDGRGGARVGAGTGLAGLSERVRTVDGRLVVDSPDGGPTTVTVELPLDAEGV